MSENKKRGRPKSKLTLEIERQKKMFAEVSKKYPLTKEEKERVKTQFLDIVKSMPSLAIFMLPGGAFLLPIVLKVIPDLIPSAFRDNQVEK